MQTEELVRHVAYDVAIIKTQYEQYKKELAMQFPENLPRLITNREGEIQLLFDHLALLLPRENRVHFSSDNNRKDAQEKGIAIYDQIEKQIAQLDCLHNAWAYEVQKILTDIRICFYYMVQEVDEMEQMCAEKKVDIPIGKC